ncbi:hypothetical protein F383_10212 [Gossypium arboreum]|uniref:Uncharacterized protein n=1 Tax=Gossypium arboreum TaxID=29729 RepID=A0A0B0NUX2_GOSAR|nr:hypothetical protein F383_10212 [Gossypium arboreum]
MSQTWSYTSSSISVPMQCPRHGFTLRHLVLMPYPRHGLTQALAYLCRCHVPDMVLHSHIS